MNLRPSNQQRGSALIAALVCLAVVMALLGSMLVGALRVSRQMHVERDRRQCELLLAAGLDRAVLRLAEDKGYSGETLELAAAEVIGLEAGQVQIEVTRPAYAASPQIKVVAEYPFGSERSVRRSRAVQLTSIVSEPKE